MTGTPDLISGYMKCPVGDRINHPKQLIGVAPLPYRAIASRPLRLTDQPAGSTCRILSIVVGVDHPQVRTPTTPLSYNVMMCDPCKVMVTQSGLTLARVLWATFFTFPIFIL